MACVCLYVYECASLERLVYVLCYVSCSSFFLPIKIKCKIQRRQIVILTETLKRFKHKKCHAVFAVEQSNEISPKIIIKVNPHGLICRLNATTVYNVNRVSFTKLIYWYYHVSSRHASSVNCVYIIVNSSYVGFLVVQHRCKSRFRVWI